MVQKIQITSIRPSVPVMIGISGFSLGVTTVLVLQAKQKVLRLNRRVLGDLNQGVAVVYNLDQEEYVLTKTKINRVP